jgi:hypothetical protein
LPQKFDRSVACLLIQSEYPKAPQEAFCVALLCLVLTTDEQLHLRYDADCQGGGAFDPIQAVNGLDDLPRGINQDVSVHNG